MRLRARPCLCDNCLKGENFRKGQCYYCWLFHNVTKWREAWGGEGPALTAAQIQELKKSRRPCCG